MKISTTLRYALRFIMLLAERSSLISTVEAANELEISPLYLRQIASKLEKSNIVKSKRGASGGYELAKSPAEISVFDIAASVEERIYLIDCLINKERCPKSFECRARIFWFKLNEEVLDTMKKTKISDILNYDISEYSQELELPV